MLYTDVCLTKFKQVLKVSGKILVTLYFKIVYKHLNLCIC